MVFSAASSLACTCRLDLHLISRQVYLCLPRGVFDGLAQEAITETAASIMRVQHFLRGQGRAVEAQLFVISQLLALREQIAPFDSGFAITQKALDFSQTRQMLRTLVEKRSFGVNAVVEFLQHGAPSVIQSQVCHVRRGGAGWGEMMG